MNDQPEFAEEYSRAERVRFIVINFVLAAALFLATQFWLLPAFREFAASAHCREVWGIPGVTVLFYGLFVGLPTSLAVIVAVLFGRRGYRILRDGQLPPAGEKVFHPTRIKRGMKAKLAGLAHLLIPLPVMALAIWGIPQAHQLSSDVQDQHGSRECVAEHQTHEIADSSRSRSAP